jgi:hypothetical protein
MESFKTLRDFDLDGEKALRAIIDGSCRPYGTIAQTIASLALFSHPDTVAQTGCKAVLTVIRNAVRRGRSSS